MAREFESANQIMNDVASEIGVSPIADPFASSNQVFSQMRNLITSAGRELLRFHTWEQLVKQHQITTAAIDSGIYPLPDDFGYMIDQTGWERSQRVPLGGPMSAQQWQYLLGRNLVSQTIYAVFRIKDGQFNIFPQPPPDGLDINFEYISRNWVEETGGSPTTYKSRVTAGSDVVLYEPILMVKYLKVKYLEAKGFDSTGARNDFGLEFDAITGQEKGAPVLNASRPHRFPYLDPLRNVPDTGYG